MVFVKGQSGNPLGKPKTTFKGKSLTEMAREHTDTALKCLVGIIGDDTAPHSAKVSASSTLLDRGWGRATQPIAGDPDMPPVNWSKAPDNVIAWMAGQALADDAPSTH